MVGPRARSARCTASSSSMSVRVQSLNTAATGTWSAIPKVRSKSEKRSPPSTASEPTAAPATTRSSSAASRSRCSRRASRCSTVNTSARVYLRVTVSRLVDLAGHRRSGRRQCWGGGNATHGPRNLVGAGPAARRTLPQRAQFYPVRCERAVVSQYGFRNTRKKGFFLPPGREGRRVTGFAVPKSRRG